MKRPLFSACLALCASGALAQEATMIVLDASGSMWGQIDGVNKIVIARDVVRDTLGAARSDNPLGLVAYGHNRKGDCSDIEVLVPPAKGQASAVISAVDRIRPTGKTPLTEAVRQAARALRHEENRATVVLVTDGLETCDADPCALARELEQSGLDFTAHVVGFGLTEEEGAAVSCLAQETGGSYFDAKDKTALATALTQTVAAPKVAPVPSETPAPKVAPENNLQIRVLLSDKGPVLEDAKSVKLALDLMRVSDGRVDRIGWDPVMETNGKAGEHVVRVHYENGAAEVPVTLRQFEVTQADVVLNAGYIDFTALHLTPGLIAENEVTFRITNLETGQAIDRYYASDMRTLFPAGNYAVTAFPGRAGALALPAVNVTVKPAQTVQGEILLNYGGLQIEPLSETGAPLSRFHIRFALWSKKPDGSKDRRINGQATTDGVMPAPPGDYLLIAEDWGFKAPKRRVLSRDLTIRPGEGQRLRIKMPADVSLPLREVRP